MKERGDESGEWMEPIEEVPLIGLGESELRIGEISAWLTERSRKLIPETRGGILERTTTFKVTPKYEKKQCEISNVIWQAVGKTPKQRPPYVDIQIHQLIFSHK